MITELTPNTSSQELFDYITTFLFKQGAQSKNKAGDCLYRGPQGRMCAIGCIIPDSIYHPDMEGLSVRNLISAGRRGVFSKKTTDKAFFSALERHDGLLSSLQTVHDFPRGPDRLLPSWDANFAKIAEKYNLTYTRLSPEEFR